MIRSENRYHWRQRHQEAALDHNLMLHDGEGDGKMQGYEEAHTLKQDTQNGTGHHTGAAWLQDEGEGHLGAPATSMPRRGAPSSLPRRSSATSPQRRERTLSPDSCNITRSNKPMMEKKRRQRINRCLNELKSLVFEAIRRDPASYSKLEKADILEMTVRHVQVLHRQEQQLKSFLKSDEGEKYRAGFVHATREVTHYLGNLMDVPTDLHQKVLKHLNNVATPNDCNVNNTNSTNVHNSVHVASPSQQPIILVLNSQPQVHTAVSTTVPITQVSVAPSMTSSQLPINQGTVQLVRLLEGTGNSLGVQPNVFIMPQQVNNQMTSTKNNSVQLSSGLSVLPTNSNSGPMTLVLPGGSSQIYNTGKHTKMRNSYYCSSETNTSLQAEAPVLASILKSAKQKKSSRSLKSQSISSNSSEYQSSLESEENSDNDGHSQMSSPVSFMSISPEPDENSYPVPPPMSGSSFTPTHNNVFREELGSSLGALQYNSSKRQPIISSKVVPPLSVYVSDSTRRGKSSLKAHKQVCRPKSSTSKTYLNNCSPKQPTLLKPIPLELRRELNDTAADMWRPW